jgi:hypothetical protein
VILLLSVTCKIRKYLLKILKAPSLIRLGLSWKSELKYNLTK